MASRTIYTGIFRVGFPHLEAPHAQNPTDAPKFSVQSMYPKTGICPVNQQPISSWESIFTALDEVCQEMWKMSFVDATAPGMGINYPPSLKDGDLKYLKDANKNPILGSIDPATAGMWLMSLKNSDPVGVADPSGTDVDPKSIYAGCWARGQVECSAYEGSHGSVVAVKLLNIQMAYDGDPLGNKKPAESAGQAFGTMAIADSNITAGQHAPIIPGALAAPATGTVIMKPDCVHTYLALKTAKYTDQQIIDAGFADPDFTK